MFINPDDILDKRIRRWYEDKFSNSNHLDHSKRYLTIVNKYPSTLELESTSRCNVNPPCPMCNRVRRTVDSEMDMPSFMVEWAANSISAAKEISISGVGEPMMASGFEKMVTLGNNANISFFSNAQVLNSSNIDLIFNENIKNIRISLDAATNETYRKIRGFTNETFDLVKKNISKIVTERTRRKTRFPSITLIMVVMLENYKELPMLVKLAGKLKVNGVRYWEMRAPTIPTDYLEHHRYDFHFSYEEQSKLPADFNEVIKESVAIARKLRIDFGEN